MIGCAWGVVRVATEEDLREAWMILGHAYDPPIWARMEDYDGYLAKVAALATTLLLKMDGQVAGGISFYDNDAGTGRAFITQVMVSPVFQGRGIGTRLIAECEAECLAKGMKVLGLEVRRDNDGAKRLYERIGFHVCGGTETGWLMEKHLGQF